MLNSIAAKKSMVTRMSKQLASVNLPIRSSLNLLAQVGARARKRVERIWLEATGPRLVSAQQLSDEAFLALFDLKEVSAWLAKGDIRAAQAALLDHYGRQVKSAWPAPPRVLTDMRLNLAELSREELIDQANSILEYRFPPTGFTPKITSAGQIDWGFNPTSTLEWLWNLNRHQWWPILGLAYARTGDERYATAFVSQMVHWVTTNPPPSTKNERSPTWRLMETGLRMRASWVPVFALFYESPNFTNEAKLIMLRSIYDHAQFLSRFTSTRNHLLRESNGLAFVSVYFPEFKAAKHWQQIALDRLDQELTGQINQDGSHIELSTGYQWLVVDEFQQAYELLRANNLKLPKENLAAWLEKMYQVLAYLIRPDGTFPEINDGFLFWPSSRLAQAGEMLGRDDFVYIGTAGQQGSPPRDTSVAFNDAGLYVMRSDWSQEARYLLFDAGPYGGPHGHEDKLSIELYAFGQPFIVDSGSYTYDKSDPFRAYFVASQGHNTVLVDGQSQVRRWQEDNLKPRVAAGNYADWLSRTGFDYVAASYHDGYGLFSFQKPEPPAMIEDVSHIRRILFVKPDYWLIVDELQAAAPHTYQWLFHTAPGLTVAAGSNNRVSLSTAPEAARLDLIPAYPENIKLSWLAGSEKPVQGWYASFHEQKSPANVVIYELEKCVSTVMATLLYPWPAGQAGDEISLEPLEVGGGEGVAFVVTTERGRDYLLFSGDDRLKQFGPYQSKGMVAGVRTDHSGRVLTRFEG